MHLSWNEIRACTARFAEEWKDAHYERGESQTFYNEFFEVFGVTRRRVASFEEPVRLLGEKRGFVDLFWKGVLLVEQKSAGFNLEKAKTRRRCSRRRNDRERSAFNQSCEFDIYNATIGSGNCINMPVFKSNIATLSASAMSSSLIVATN